jgi:hypothetical protein
MRIYLAGGYLKPTSDILSQEKANRLFTFYDLFTNRIQMLLRFQELIKELKNEDISSN